MEQRSLQYIATAAGGELAAGEPLREVCRICTDSRQAEPGDIFFALSGERFDGHTFLRQVAGRGVAAVVAERSKIPSGLCGCAIIAVDNTRLAIGRLAARYRSDFVLPVIVVGGSNGKTSTKEMIASVMRQKLAALWSEASFNNDIGVPLTLLKLEASHRVAVIEAGTNHPGELAPLVRMIAPNFGVITNIGREHLEFFGDLEGVAREEGSIAEALPANGVLFLNGDDKWSGALAARTNARVVRVGFGEGNDVRAMNARFDENGAVFEVKCNVGALNGEYRLRLLGRHQILNALFAFAIGAELGFDRGQIADGLSQCLPAKMRLQMFQADGITILDDCYNANADSMIAALQTLSQLPCAGKRVAVLGDMAELGATSSEAHREVGRKAAELKVGRLLSVGARAAEISDSARSAGLGDVIHCGDADEAVAALTRLVCKGDVVLVKASRAMRLERISEALRKGEAA